MGYGIHAQGVLGIAFETTPGTYVAPTKSFPIISENLQYMQNTQWRRVIRGVADNVGAVSGFYNVQGEITMELMEDALPYFLQVSRNSVAKTGAGPYTYTTTPIHIAAGAITSSGLPKNSMSITVLRNGQYHGFLGCVVTSIEFAVSNGIPTMKFGILGLDEATQSSFSPTFLATSIPFAPGQYSIEIPTSTQVFDVDNFTWTMDDNGSPQFRLSNVRKPQFIQFGQRNVSLKMDRDFVDRTELDAFKALTSNSVSIVLTKSANAKVTLKMAAAIRDDYSIDGLNDQGSLQRASVSWQGTYDTSTSKSYELIVICSENIT